MTSSVFTLAQKPELRDAIDRLSAGSWPRFLLHGNAIHWHLLFEMFPGYQLLLCDQEGELIAVGHTVPLVWDGSLSDLPGTIDDILLRAGEAVRDGRTPNAISALAAMVSAGHRGQGISRIVVGEMRALARRCSCTSLIAPVRPSWKSRYPLTPFERYVGWKMPDGTPFDPWIRVHHRLGAVPLAIAPDTLTVEGSVADWEGWTGMAFPESGSYVVPGALHPVSIDLDSDRGRYEDPNLWMLHALDPEP